MEKPMKFQPIFNKRGITLIELLVALVISAITMAAIYRIFISQTKVYYVQDQVVETQQSVRSAMEILLRDLRMTGFDDDNLNSKYNDGTPIQVVNPIATTATSITVTYEYFDRTLGVPDGYELHTVAYALETVGGVPTLVRRRTITKHNKTPQNDPQESLLPNVTALNFTYGVDDNDDDVLDRWATFDAVGVGRVIAVRVVLTARPDQTNPDVQKAVSPRKLDSIVMMRNLCLR
jgi:prepilin-type N-terminal cleavage/methylation domain-containing protein